MCPALEVGCHHRFYMYLGRPARSVNVLVILIEKNYAFFLLGIIVSLLHYFFVVEDLLTLLNNEPLGFFGVDCPNEPPGVPLLGVPILVQSL